MWLNENECSDEELVLFTSNSDCRHCHGCASCDICDNYNDETNSDKK